MLERVDGAVRVLILLRSQELLVAASDPRAQEQLEAEPGLGAASTGHIVGITRAEKAMARRAEAAYEAVVNELAPAAQRTATDIERVRAKVRRAGGVILDTKLIPAALTVRVPAGSLGAIERIGAVDAIEPAPKPRPLSSIGWQAVGAPAWFAAGFTGGTGGSDTVPADAGVTGEIPDSTHPAFTGVAIDSYAGYTPSGHGTRTASILASQDAVNRGVAYGVDRLVSGDPAFQLGFPANGHPGAPDPAEVLNLSFGSHATSDDEGDIDDVTTAFFGVSQAMGAGNDNVDGSPTVDNIGRNTMSVAGLNDMGTLTTTDDVVLGFSARGPTPGGRKKPDLIAPGGAVVAADIDWNTPPSNPDYTAQSGTSFSAPHVAGAMTLLEGAGITDPMAQRAILINSARDWNGTNTGLHGWTAPQAGWRPEVGWGILDLETALAQRGDYRLDSVPEGEASFFRATVPAGAKATLAYQVRGYFTGYPGPPYPVQTLKYTQSNLDLRQYDSAGAEIAPPAAFDPPDTTIDPGPDAVDPNDTVEQVRAPTADTITYKVQSASTIDGAAAEPFAIAGAAALTPLASPTVRPNSVDASDQAVRCGQPVTITTAARNDSPDLAADNAELAIGLPPGVQLVSGAAVQSVSSGHLATSTTSEGHGWTVEATTEGSKVITIEGAGDAYGTTFHDSGQVTFAADCTPPATSIDSGPAGPTNDSAPIFTFSATGANGGGFECSLDSAAFTGCGSPLTVSSLSDGAHTLRVRAIDVVGNVDPTPAARSFNVDTEPPDTTIGSGPSGAIRASSASFGLAGGERYECRLDGAGFTPCPPSASVADLHHGPHAFSARAIDAAGNVDPTPAGREFSVDLKVSNVRLTAKPRQRIGRGGLVKVGVAIGEAGSVAVRGSAGIGRRILHLRTARMRSGGATSGTLRLTARPAVARAIAEALDRGTVRVTLDATFKDRLGNRGKRTQTVRVRG